MRYSTRIPLWAESAWKFLLSFLKSSDSWTARDYPIQFGYIEGGNVDGGNWVAKILKTTYSGRGKTKDEALKALDESLRDRRRYLRPIPRPGMAAPLEFASTTVVSQYEDIAEEFLERVLLLDPTRCFISDESSLHDFPEDEQAKQRLLQIYGVDLDTLPSDRLVDIFAAIRRIPKKSESHP